MLEVAPDTAEELITSDSVSILSVNVWVLCGPTPFVAPMHTVYVPPASAPGVPERRPLSEKVTPTGKGSGVQAPNAVFETWVGTSRRRDLEVARRAHEEHGRARARDRRSLSVRTRDDRSRDGRTRELGVGRTHPERTDLVAGSLDLIEVGRTRCQTRVGTRRRRRHQGRRLLTRSAGDLLVRPSGRRAPPDEVPPT